MADPIRYRVMPHPEGGWQVKRDGSDRASKRTGSQRRAEQLAQELAAKVGGEVVVYGADGRRRDPAT